MKQSLIRTVIVTSLITALAGTALAFYVPRAIGHFGDEANAQPVVSPPPDTSVTDEVSQPATINRPHAYVRHAEYASPDQGYGYGEPVVSKHRSTEKSVAIVAGSAGAGAAIGALAGGGKGAGIGAIAGGVAGLIYDRATAH